MPCRFCEAVSPTGKTYCEKCYNDIMERYPTMPTTELAAEYGMTKSAMIGFHYRIKPDGTKPHPKAVVKSMAARRRNRYLEVALDEVHRPNITNRQKIDGCRWIDHEDEIVYGETKPGADWEYCQRPQLPKKQYCAHHYPRTVRPLDKKPRSTFVNNIKGSARLPEMAYA